MNSLMIGLVIANVVLGLAVVILLLNRNQRRAGEELLQRLTRLEVEIQTYHKVIQQEQTTARQELENRHKNMREELANNFQRISDMVLAQLSAQSEFQARQLSRIAGSITDMVNANAEQQDKLRKAMDANMKELQSSNELKLDQMRATVDEKLNATLANRLDQSFKQVGDQLQQLYKSIGEMQALAGGVNDLNRILTNVKTRGTWGEVQLGSLLEQTMTPEQYAKNVATKKNSDQRVEYAIKLPGKDDGASFVWLPIDAKFAQEDYLKLLNAADAGDAVGVEEAAKGLENRVKNDARMIRDKYTAPPETTDFAIMFLPTEGLYAEVLRRPGLAEFCQTNYRVMIAGPTTLTALLNSLRMGFASLAIEKKSSEVWKLLRAIKTQYGTFTELLDKSLKKIGEAQNSMEQVKNRSEMINKRLRKVEELNPSEVEKILGLETEKLSPARQKPKDGAAGD